MTWINLLIILFSCAIFVFIKKILTKHKREIKLLLLMVFMDSFLGGCPRIESLLRKS